MKTGVVFIGFFGYAQPGEKNREIWKLFENYWIIFMIIWKLLLFEYYYYLKIIIIWKLLNIWLKIIQNSLLRGIFDNALFTITIQFEIIFS